jgi:hypothetical protein
MDLPRDLANRLRLPPVVQQLARSRQLFSPDKRNFQLRMASEILAAIFYILRNLRSDGGCIFTTLAAEIGARRSRDHSAASAMNPMRFKHNHLQS